jgi:hypothetical protein
VRVALVRDLEEDVGVDVRRLGRHEALLHTLEDAVEHVRRARLMHDRGDVLVRRALYELCKLLGRYVLWVDLVLSRHTASLNWLSDTGKLTPFDVA